MKCIAAGGVENKRVQDKMVLVWSLQNVLKLTTEWENPIVYMTLYLSLFSNQLNYSKLNIVIDTLLYV